MTDKLVARRGVMSLIRVKRGGMCDISWCWRAEYCRSRLDGIGYVVKFSLTCLEIGFL